MDKTTMDIFVFVWMCVFISLGEIPREEISSSLIWEAHG